jgi:hypothetical protein
VEIVLAWRDHLGGFDDFSGPADEFRELDPKIDG